ncbi:MAG: KTSC domain-containing protein [Nitrososphaerales archaeon]
MVQGKVHAWLASWRARRDGEVWCAPEGSTVFRSLSYNRKRRTLTAEFARGAHYRYDHVPPALARALFAAESAGRFFNSYIRGRYPTWKLV